VTSYCFLFLRHDHVLSFINIYMLYIYLYLSKRCTFECDVMMSCIERFTADHALLPCLDHKYFFHLGSYLTVNAVCILILRVLCIVLKSVYKTDFKCNEMYEQQMHKNLLRVSTFHGCHHQGVKWSIVCTTVTHLHMYLNFPIKSQEKPPINC